jgi:hypothetical protein
MRNPTNDLQSLRDTLSEFCANLSAAMEDCGLGAYRILGDCNFIDDCDRRLIDIRVGTEPPTDTFDLQMTRFDNGVSRGAVITVAAVLAREAIQEIQRELGAGTLNRIDCPHELGAKAARCIHCGLSTIEIVLDGLPSTCGTDG